MGTGPPSQLLILDALATSHGERGHSCARGRIKPDHVFEF